MSAGVALAIGAFLLAGLYQGLRVKRYQIVSGKISGTVRLLLLSDLHGLAWGEKQAILIEKARSEAPDAIVLAGDMFDCDGRVSNVAALLKGIAPLAPTFFVTGSHDFLLWDMKTIHRTLVDAGVRPLSGERAVINVRGNMLAITGIDEVFKAIMDDEKDEIGYYIKNLTAVKPRDTRVFNVLAAHRPEFIDAYRQAGFDLGLTGHAHGGQVRIPFLLNGLYAPGQGLFPKYAAGLYRRNGYSHVVSRGLHFSYTRPRFFNRPEMVVIDVTGEQKR